MRNFDSHWKNCGMDSQKIGSERKPKNKTKEANTAISRPSTRRKMTNRVNIKPKNLIQTYIHEHCGLHQTTGMNSGSPER